MSLTRTLAALLVGVSASLSAQGNLSTQGLGFPPGQLGPAARVMGGAIGEADPMSALNPAALGLLTSPIVLISSEPEFRTLRLGALEEKTSVSRFPLFLGALPLGSRWAIALSASTLVDRTWSTTIRDTLLMGGDLVGVTFTERSEGSISDLRAALSWAPATWLRLGIGGHAFTGRDVLEAVTTFDDSARFARDAQVTSLSFSGNAVSVGVQGFFPRVAAIGVAYRRGGGLSTYNGDRNVGTGEAPDHFGVSAAYLGIRGTTLALRAAHDRWSNLRGVQRTLNVHDGWDLGVGADVSGPVFGATNPIALRVGGRWRTLPFSAGPNGVRETTASGGFGLPMARGRAELSIGALYSIRTGDAGAKENAWTLSTGFAVRP